MSGVIFTALIVTYFAAIHHSRRMAFAVGKASASLTVALRASKASAGRKVALPHAAKPSLSRSTRRNVIVKAVETKEETQLSTELSDYDDGRDEDWNITYFPGMQNIESMIDEIYANGYNKKICIYAPGGVAEQMLLLPLIESIHTRLPSVKIDVVCRERAKSAYDICPYVHNTFPYNVGGEVIPDNFAEMTGTLKGEYYECIISAQPAGAGEAFLLWMASSGNLLGYTESGAGSIVANAMYTTSEVTTSTAIGNLGTSAFDSLEALVGEKLGGSYDTSVLPKVGVPAKYQEWASEALSAAGVPADFVIAHGVPSKSAAAMTVGAFPESTSMDLSALGSVSKAVVVAAPRADDKAATEAALGDKVTVLVVDTAAKLAALVQASSGVVAANSAALAMASYMSKPAVGIFESEEVAAKYKYAGVTCVGPDGASSAVAAL